MSAVEKAGLAAAAGRHFAALGITAACDADTRRDTLTAYAEADERGLLGARIAGLMVHDEAD
jgi:predicted amidohydrolase YtcJ